MAITLGSNIASLRAQRQLTKTSGELGTVFERLSSGQRINHASDDAAGLAIADKLKADAKLYSTAMRNINDGISLISIADSAIGAQKDIVLRLTELAEQSANGVYSSKQRDALSLEYVSLVAESKRIAETTEFNGIKLLKGERGGAPNLSIQAAINGSAVSRIALPTIDTGEFAGIVAGNGDYDSDGFVNFTDLGIYLNAQTASVTIDDLIAAVGPEGIMRIEVQDSNGQTRDIYGVIAVAGYNGAGAPLPNSPGNLFLYAFDNGILSEALGAPAFDPGNIQTELLTFADSSEATVSFDFRALQEGVTAINPNVPETLLEFTGIETQVRARHALGVLGNRLASLSSIQGQLGAVQSRLDVANNLTAAMRENSLAAESQIRSADIAEESSRLVRLGILQQAGAAILAQANQQPSLVLDLLR